MKIAMIISNPFPPEEGIGYYTYNLAKKLIENGHEVTIITRGSLKTEKFFFKGIQVIKVPFLPLYPFHVQIHGIFLNKFFKGIEDEFDLVHIHSPLAPIVKTDLPIISTIHTSLIEDMKHFQVSNINSTAIKLTTKISGYPLTQKLINKSNYVTTVSSSVAEELVSYYNTKNPIVVGNGVDEKRFYPIKENQNNDPYALYVGRLDYRKGILDLMKASILLKEDNIKLLVAGEGHLRSLIEDYIQKNDLQNVSLLGHVSGENLVELYQNAMIFVFPSHYEGLPTVLLEAMSCGLPVVTSNIPAHRGVITNFKNGLFAKSGSSMDIYDKINILIDDEDLRQKLGNNARKTIENKFTWDKISIKYEEIYKAAVKGEFS
jgi:glycosyltransferase involved in cell wall biosynthesis